MGCRLDLAKEWGLRIKHEASLHEESSFLTLTYSDEYLPQDGSLSVREMQLFIKKLRDRIAPQRIRYYLAGEYGDHTLRPHYHLIIFGYMFPDRTKWAKTAQGHMRYRSKILADLWPYGISEIGAVTRASGAYVAAYCLKKVSGFPAEDHYNGRTPPFALMSTRPGIGAGWFNRFECDAFPSAFIVENGKKYPVPRYYKNKLRDRYTGPRGLATIFDDADRQRAHHGNAHRFTDEYISNSTDERLAVREESQRLKQARFTREIDKC